MKAICTTRADEIRCQIDSLNNAIDFIVGLSGNYCDSLGRLQENGLSARLDDTAVRDEGMEVLASLRNIRLDLESELDEQTA